MKSRSVIKKQPKFREVINGYVMRGKRRRQCSGNNFLKFVVLPIDIESNFNKNHLI